MITVMTWLFQRTVTNHRPNPITNVKLKVRTQVEPRPEHLSALAAFISHQQTSRIIIKTCKLTRQINQTLNIGYFHCPGNEFNQIQMKWNGLTPYYHYHYAYTLLQSTTVKQLMMRTANTLDKIKDESDFVNCVSVELI